MAVSITFMAIIFLGNAFQEGWLQRLCDWQASSVGGLCVIRTLLYLFLWFIWTQIYFPEPNPKSVPEFSCKKSSICIFVQCLLCQALGWAHRSVARASTTLPSREVGDCVCAHTHATCGKEWSLGHLVTEVLATERWPLISHICSCHFKTVIRSC